MVISLIIFISGFLFLLFYWAYVVGRELWLSWKKDGSDLSPGVRKFSLFFYGSALTDGISDPRCKNYYGAPSCMRAYHAASLLGRMQDVQSLDVLVSAATMTLIDAKISETAKHALRDIGNEVISPLLESPDLRQRNIAVKALAVINE